MEQSIGDPGDGTPETRDELILDLLRFAAIGERWHRDHLNRLVKLALAAGVDPQSVASAAHMREVA